MTNVSLKMTVLTDGVSFPVRVTPRARRNSVDGVHEGVLRVHLTAPPDQGKANAALIALLADLVGVRRSQVEILAGLANRNKVVRIRHVTPGQIGSSISA
ncbi:MAG TPA: DUF167 family protein [Candidatus Binatia bacterium]|nr:DUF167 family protein [Candidatus Binatia bacterium]